MLISVFQFTVVLESVNLISQINCLVTQRLKHFQLQTCRFFLPGLIVSGLVLNIFHKMSPRTHHNCFYYMEKSVLLGTKPLVDSIRHFIRDPSGVFSVCHLCECRIVQ